MRRILLFIALLTGTVTFAQNEKNVVIKGGTIIPMQSTKTVKAADVEVGQTVNFQVTQDIFIDGTCVIPRGTMVKGNVTEAKKSSIAGTKGRLKININHLYLPSGDPIFFTDTNINICGDNRTPMAVVMGVFLWPCIFIPGTKTVMPEGYEVLATVAANTRISVE